MTDFKINTILAFFVILFYHFYKLYYIKYESINKCPQRNYATKQR